MKRLLLISLTLICLYACHPGKTTANQAETIYDVEYQDCEKSFIDLLKSCPNFKEKKEDGHTLHAMLDKQYSNIYLCTLFHYDDINTIDTIGQIKWDVWYGTFSDISDNPDKPIKLDYNQKLYIDFLECMGYPKNVSEPNDTVILPKAEKASIDIILPAFYRGEKLADYNHLLDEDWGELYQNKEHQFFLTKAQIVIGRFDDQCVGGDPPFVSSIRNDSILHLQDIHQKADDYEQFKNEETLIFIKGIPFSDTPFPNVNLDKDYVFTGHEETFDFGGKKYTLRADGIDLRTGEEKEIDCWENVKNYKLYLSDNETNIEQLLVAMPFFNGTYVKILFIGDLDSDNKPDFLFDVSGDYECKYVVLFLSSKADKGQIVKCVGESIFVFDC